MQLVPDILVNFPLMCKGMVVELVLAEEVQHNWGACSQEEGASGFHNLDTAVAVGTHTGAVVH